MGPKIGNTFYFILLVRNQTTLLEIPVKISIKIPITISVQFMGQFSQKYNNAIAFLVYMKNMTGTIPNPFVGRL